MSNNRSGATSGKARRDVLQDACISGYDDDHTISGRNIISGDSMVRAIGATLLLVLAGTVGLLAGESLPLGAQIGLPFLVSLLALGALAWGFGRNRGGSI
jgi:hypothetical protein